MITDRLSQTGVAAIRNKVEHSRSDFPAPAEISALIDVVQDVVARMLKIGLLPVTYRIQKRTHDEWGRQEMLYQNYRGDAVNIPYKSGILLATLPEAPKFGIFMPSIRLEQTEDIVRFTLAEDSEYARMWKNYPIRGNSKRNRPEAADGPGP